MISVFGSLEFSSLLWLLAATYKSFLDIDFANLRWTLSHVSPPMTRYHLIQLDAWPVCVFFGGHVWSIVGVLSFHDVTEFLMEYVALTLDVIFL